jgi:hypothetical protein
MFAFSLSACAESDQARREREVREFEEDFRYNHFQVNHDDTILPGYRDSVEAVLARHRRRVLDPRCDAWLACEDGLPAYYPQMDAIVARLRKQHPDVAARIDSAQTERNRRSAPASEQRVLSGSKWAWEDCVRRVVARERDRGATQSEQAFAGTIECADLDPDMQEAIRKDAMGY